MEDELIRIWQSSPQEERIKFDKSRLILDMQSSLDRLNRLIKFGILSEQIAAVFVIPIFTYLVFWWPHVISKIGSVFIVVWVIWYMFRLWDFKKTKPAEMTSTYLDYLNRSRTYLARLKKMGDSAFFWYLGPCMLGALLIMLGPISSGTLSVRKSIIFLSLHVCFTLLMHFYIKWNTKTQYGKRLEKIDKLIKVMEE